MASMVPKHFKAVRTGSVATDTRTLDMTTEVAQFIEQYVVKDDDKHKHVDWQAIEDAMGLEHGMIYRLYSESEARGNTHTALILGVLFGMWAMDTRYHHLETKPLSVTE